MKRKKRLLAAGGLLAFLLLSGCGAAPSGGQQPAASAAPVETAAPTPAPTPVETEAPVPVETAAPVPAEPAATAAPQDASGPFTGVAGTQFVVPEGFVQLDETPSIGYQYTFWHPEREVRIVVYEIAPGKIPEGAYEIDRNIAKTNPDVTYFNEGDTWFVQSGYNRDGAEIFYSKECDSEQGLKTLWISYPTAGREYGDAIAAEFEKNCKF